MKVLLYSGLNKLVEKSGVGVAMEHQKNALSDAGISYTTSTFDDYDVMQINTVLPNSLIQGKLAKMKDIPVVYYAHSTMEDFRNSFVLSNALAPFFKKWIVKCYNTSDLIITPTEYSKRLLESYDEIESPIISLSNGIDTEFYKRDERNRERFRKKYGIERDKKVVISVGHLIERKGIIDFIELAKEFPKVDFYWFGYTAPPLITPKVANAIKDATKNVKFPGFVNKEELRDAYQGSDIFLFMSHEETEGIVVLEALASEVGVLLRDIPVYEGWLQDGKNCYKAKDNQEFKIILSEMLKEERKDLTSEGLKLAKERDIAQIGERLQAIYKKVEKKRDAKKHSLRIGKTHNRKDGEVNSKVESLR